MRSAGTRLPLTARFGALRERPFRLLWLGQTASAAGDALIPVALAFAILDDLDGSAGDLGLVLASFTIARVALILAGGVWADRLPRRLVMVGADVVRAAVQAFVAAMLLAGAMELWMFVATSAVVGFCSAFFRPAAAGLVPETVSRDRLQQANALISLSRTGVQIFGPVLAGLLVAGAGAGWVFAFDAATFAASAAFLLVLSLPPAARAARQRFVGELAAGWREVTSRTWLWASLLMFSLTNISIASFFVLGPLVVQRELDGATDWGLIMTGSAIGGVVGSAIALRYHPMRPLLPGFLLVLPTALELGLLARPFPPVVIACAAGVSFGGIVIANALWQTVMQQQIPGDRLSRVSSYDALVSFVFMPVGYALAGPLAMTIGLDRTIWGAAGLVVASILLGLAVPAVRNLRRA